MNARSVKSPMNRALNDDSIPKLDPLPNDEQRLFGSTDSNLIYLAAITRSDRYVAASILGAYIERSAKLATVAARLVLRYHTGTINVSIILHPSDGTSLSAFVDSD